RAAITQYGLRSHLTQQLLQYIFTADLLIPYDSQQIASIFLSALRSATAGSAGVDVETAVDVTLLTTGVYLLDSTVKGPLGGGLCALLLGRSSTSRQGIFVIPGVIDADYTGVIKIMVYTLTPPVSIPKGSRIAQLIPFRPCVPQPGDKERGDGGFGSTGSPQVYFTMDISKTKPELTVTMIEKGGDRKVIKMMLDTGADVTVISASQWPQHWPVTNAYTGIFGIGGVQMTK
ncbi:POK9 protein, partial [Penelope pileata]|nr:POK9 protein [Penelope pileata]